MKKTILILMTGVTIFAACKKSDSVPAKTTQEKVLGKWGVTSIVVNDYNNGTLNSNTYNGVSTDYFDFGNDGKLNIQVGVSANTATYSVLSDKYIRINADSMEIKTLTDNSFVLYSKQVSGTNYLEVTETLKK